MRQTLLASVLIGVAVLAFVVGRSFWPVPAVGQPLGDLSAIAAIATEVQAIAEGGDLAAAKARIKDLETAWDDAEAVMRPKDPKAWGRVDQAADDALSALRAGTPDPTAVKTAMVALVAMLADPGQGGAADTGVVMVGNIPVTDASGHPLPCESMLADVNSRLAATTMTAEAGAAIGDLVAKATERCNADDDRNANAFSAKALQMLTAG
jgi:hypothetical protein